MQPAGSDEFGEFGTLGLKAATLQYGLSYKGEPTAQLGIVLPPRKLWPGNTDQSAFTVATITLDGHTNGETREAGPGWTLDEHLRYSIGLTQPEKKPSGMMCGGGSFDWAMGFPGATQYLANALPDIGKYFTALATALTTKHSH